MPDAVRAVHGRRRVPWLGIAFTAVLVCYALLTIGVLYQSPVLTLDKWFYVQHWHWRHDVPQVWKRWISWYVAFGQRGPATLVLLPWFIWVAKRDHSPRPLVLLGTSLILLNLSVGVVKYSIARIGPLRTSNVHDLFAAGGTIYPSGHVSNAVVLYGLLAWIAGKHRTLLISVAVFICATVGIGTVYLNTHWFSDVVGGWIAGGLVLLALPWVMPTAERWTEAALTRYSARRARRQLLRAMPEGTPQENVTPVSSAARSQSLPAVAASFDARDEPTRRGKPRISPIPSGP